MILKQNKINKTSPTTLWSIVFVDWKLTTPLWRTVPLILICIWKSLEVKTGFTKVF